MKKRILTGLLCMAAALGTVVYAAPEKGDTVIFAGYLWHEAY